MVAVADSFHPDGLLAFDTPEATGRVDHVAATATGVLAAETLGLPVLGWTLSETAATQLNREFGVQVAPDRAGEVDLRVTVDRAGSASPATQVRARHLRGALAGAVSSCSPRQESFRWLRPPRGLGYRASRVQDTTQT